MTEIQLLTPAQVGKILGVTPRRCAGCGRRARGRDSYGSDHTPRYREDELLGYIEERVS